MESESDAENTQAQTLTISMPTVKSKKSKEKKIDPKTLEGFVELKKEYIRHLHGSWLKYVNISTKKVEVGGFLDKLENSTAYLRCPSRDNTKVNMDENIFFVKDKDLNYLALLELLREKERELFSLYSYKKKIVNMINNGEIKFKKVQ